MYSTPEKHTINFVWHESSKLHAKEKLLLIGVTSILNIKRQPNSGVEDNFSDPAEAQGPIYESHLVN